MSNPPANSVAITQRGAMVRDDNNFPTGFLYKSITTTATTLVKSGAGFLHCITFNKPVATGTLEIDDALTNTSPVVGTITTPASPQPYTIFYDIAFSTGLSITTGTASQDITVCYV